MSTTPQPVAFAIDDTQRVSGLLLAPPAARACYVMAHGAGAGMAHPFMANVANDLASRGIATLRYQFAYTERGSKRPDPPKLAHAAVRAAVAAASRLLPELALFAGGKSYGGRMTSQAQGIAPLPGVRGLVFLGFPLHPAGEPSASRAAHLPTVQIPMLFLQGTRDEFADLRLVKGIVGKLGARATLRSFDDADHSFHVPARTGRKDSEVRAEMADALVEWIDKIPPPSAAAPAGRAQKSRA
jgi:predicted alpha/beta-hydrolase family hydrolase